MSKMEDILALLITGFVLSASLLAAPAGRGSAPLGSLPPLLTKIASAEGFSFRYGGKACKEFLPAWKRGAASRRLPDGRRLETITYQDPASGLEVSRELTRFPGFAAIEVMLRIRNTGKTDTPMLESIFPLDVEFEPPGAEDAVLHYVLGSASRNVQDGAGGMTRDFSPVNTPLSRGAAISLIHYVMKGHEHVESYLPFFNMQWRGGGMIGGLGWSGQWLIQAKRGGSRNVGLQAGQATTHFILHPGESVRTPRVLLLQWAGQDRIQGHNLWRRLLVSYYVPRLDGQVALPPIAYTCDYLLQFEDIAKKTGRNPLEVMPTLKLSDLGSKFIDQTPALNWVTEENQLDLLRRLPAIGLDTYWIDAGWFEGLWPNGRGSWVPKKDFPRGLKPIGDAAHARGLKLLLWFDPEGVAPGSFIAKEHPEWVLHHPKEGEWGGIFKWSDPAATRYMTDLIARCIGDWGVDIYRNDRNTVPEPFWKQADAPDRQGITEIRQIEGLYAFFDGLRERFPKLTIDNANWRGTGPDLEMMQRSLGSLTRSELTSAGLPFPIADQAQTLELSLWIPLDSNLLHAVDPYNFRSTMTTGIGIGMNLLSPYVSVDELSKGIAELKSVRPYWLGDYYPLTPANLDESTWAGWQFNRPEMGGGFAVLFRRPKSERADYAARLRGLEPKASYEVSFAETFQVKAKRVMTGAELSRLRVEVASAPGSVMIRYRKAQGQGEGGN